VITAAGQLPLPASFECDRAKVFAALKRPLCYLASGIRAFSECTGKAVRILDEQRTAATLPRLKSYYASEAARLIDRVERLKRKAISEGRM